MSESAVSYLTTNRGGAINDNDNNNNNNNNIYCLFGANQNINMIKCALHLYLTYIHTIKCTSRIV